MSYSKWASTEDVKRNLSLKAISVGSEVKSSGLPLMYDDQNLYINGNSNHSLIIGTSGSGKTQTITLPFLELSRKAGESVVIHDSNDVIYDETADKFKKSGYEVLKIDLQDYNNWSPFNLAYYLYQQNNFEKCQEVLDEMGCYIFHDESDADPFWANEAKNYFVGLALYAYEKGEEVNFTKIYELSIEFVEKKPSLLATVDPKSKAYVYLSGIKNAPEDTRLSIISVFQQFIKLYVVSKNLNVKVNETKFDFKDFLSKKAIIYISSENSRVLCRLVPLFITQLYQAKNEFFNKEGKINVLIDDFYLLEPIIDFTRILNYSRNLGIIFTIVIRGFNDLKNVYGIETAEMVKSSFPNIVYLLSQDLDTLTEISKYCGMKNDNESLISIEELKTLEMFEAIILMPRVLPFRTKLLPYFEMEKLTGN